MQALAEKTSAATTREELGAFLAGHIRQALHPSSLAIYLEDRSGSLVAVQGASPAGPERILPAGSSQDRVSEGGRRVPLFGRDGRQAGVILLGERLSEEPYSREDWSLLTSVASQAALALENIRLAEQIAVRLEAERRTTVELELAKEVQSKLLPRARL